MTGRTYIRKRPEDRFWRHVNIGPGCWEWQRACQPAGYGAFHDGNSHIGAHRFAYMQANGKREIPPGLCVMHVCDNRKCVRPDHLRLGTKGDNNTDRHLKGRDRKKQPCREGCVDVPENWRWYRGKRMCKPCTRRRAREKYHASKANQEAA